ncbi:hypothetical protein V8J82_11795 [Gymnodinialimonas sp. 2305UL16-5]|uniref:hypothetical protein n=1 Tax=Gymnodinialimonas mytili TaxID=3126503 RepID=UPI00309CFECC
MRALFWIVVGLGLVLLARQISIVDAHFLVHSSWVLPFGIGISMPLALIGAAWGWRIASQPIRKHEREQFRLNNSPSKMLIYGGRAPLPTSQLPSIAMFFIGFVSWGAVGFFAIPMALAIVVGQTQVTTYEVVGLNYSDRARGFVVRSNEISVRLRNVPNSVFLEAELGDSVLVIGRGTSMGQFYDTIELR